MTRQLVVIACGAAKLDRPAPASQLYVGGQFRLALAAAQQLAARADIAILSAKHGLLGLDQWVAPYDLKMGQAGSVTTDQLARQATARGLTGCQVIALCPGRYAQALADVWTDIQTPLAGLGIGYQRQVLAAIRDGRYSLTFAGLAT